MAKKIDAEFFNAEVGLAWLALYQEFGKDPKELARLDKCKWRKSEMVFDWLQKEMKIPPGDPFTVAKAVGKYLTKIGYANVEVFKLADNIIRYNGTDMIMIPMARYLSSQGLKVFPQPSNSIFITAFQKLCHMKVEDIPLPPEERAKLPANIYQRTWRLSPIK